MATSGRVLGVRFYHCSGAHFSEKRCSFARILLPCVSDGFTRWQSLPTSPPYLTVYLVLFRCTCGVYALECARRQALTPEQDFGGLPPSYPTLLLQGRVFLRRSSLLILPVEVPCWGYSGWICLSPPHNTGVMGTHSHAWPFTSMQGNQTQDFILSEQELYPLSNLTSPWISSIHPLFTSLAQKKKKKRNFWFLFYLLACVCSHMHSSIYKSQKKVLGHLELELQMLWVARCGYCKPNLCLLEEQ